MTLSWPSFRFGLKIKTANSNVLSLSLKSMWWNDRSTKKRTLSKLYFEVKAMKYFTSLTISMTLLREASINPSVWTSSILQTMTLTTMMMSQRALEILKEVRRKAMLRSPALIHRESTLFLITVFWKIRSSIKWWITRSRLKSNSVCQSRRLSS